MKYMREEYRSMRRGSTRGQGAWRRARQASLVGFVALLFILLGPGLAHASSGPDWPTYQSTVGRSGNNKAETVISPTSAPKLKLHWTHTAAGSISTQPIVANNAVYWGSWDNGEEHATDFNNNRLWTYGTGVTTDASCLPSTAGVASSSTIATVTIKGTATPVDFFGGGTASGGLYALNATTGTLIWHTSLGSTPSNFIWSSPAIYNGYVYIGVSSFGDCPLVQGKEVQLNASTGAIVNTFTSVPGGCIGAGIWGSATVDASGNGGKGAIYVTTGNGGNCSGSEPYAYSIIELSASNVSQVIGHWAVPAGQQVSDSDFGATPVLFNANGTKMVGAVNKNGYFYAFKRDALSAGPVWSDKVGSGGDCPQCGSGNISPASWDGSTLYLASGNTSINNTSCKGSVRAVNPATGTYIWQHCLTSGPVLGPVASANGVLAVSQGQYLMVVQASNGKTLFSYQDTNSGSLFYGGPSISHGIIYVGNMDGRLYAFGT